MPRWPLPLTVWILLPLVRERYGDHVIPTPRIPRSCARMRRSCARMMGLRRLCQRWLRPLLVARRSRVRLLSAQRLMWLVVQLRLWMQSPRLDGEEPGERRL